MSDHLPECDKGWSYPDFLVSRGIKREDCWMCELLTEAEQRGVDAQLSVDLDVVREEGKQAMREYLLADDENAWAQGYREGVRDERERIRTGVMEVYRVAPKAAESILRVIDSNPTKCGRAHGDMCCSECDEHATPHRGCILR